MADSDLNTADVLLNRGLNSPYAYGYGFGQKGNFGYDGSVLNANVLANRDIGLTEVLNRTASDQATRDRLTDGQIDLKNTIQAQSINDRFASVERLLFANQAATDRDITEVRLKLGECCCKLEAGQAAILAKIEADGRHRAEIENQNLNMQVQIMQNRGN